MSRAANQEERSMSLRIDAQVCDGTTESVTSYLVTVTEKCERYPYCANGEEWFYGFEFKDHFTVK